MSENAPSDRPGQSGHPAAMGATSSSSASSCRWSPQRSSAGRSRTVSRKLRQDPRRHRQQRQDPDRSPADGGRTGAVGVADRPEAVGDQAGLDADRHRRRQGRDCAAATTTRCSPSLRTSPRAILSSGTDKPVSGKVQLVSNAAASTTVPYISAQVVAAATHSLGNQTTQGYLKNVYGGFNQIAKSNESAASSTSTSLAGGFSQVSAGASQLTDGGSDTLASSLGQVASGTASLHDGHRVLRSGAAELEQAWSGCSRSAEEDCAPGAADLARRARAPWRREGDELRGPAAGRVATGSDALAPTGTGRVAPTARATADPGRSTGSTDQCLAAGRVRAVLRLAETRRATTRTRDWPWPPV